MNVRSSELWGKNSEQAVVPTRFQAGLTTWRISVRKTNLLIFIHAPFLFKPPHIHNVVGLQESDPAAPVWAAGLHPAPGHQSITGQTHNLVNLRSHLVSSHPKVDISGMQEESAIAGENTEGLNRESPKPELKVKPLQH